MKKFSQLSIKYKLVTTVVAALFLLVITIFGYIALKMKPLISDNIETIADNSVSEYANLFKSYLSEDMAISRTIAESAESLYPYSAEMKLKRTSEILQRVFLNHPGYRSIYCSWERKYVDNNWDKDYGRIRVTMDNAPTSENDFSGIVYDTLNSNGDDLNGSYYQSKIDRKDVLANPYQDVFNGEIQTVTSVFNILSYNGEFLGSNGLDIPLSRYAEIINNAERFYSSYIFLLSNDGVFVGNQVPKLIGKSIEEIVKGDELQIIKDNIKLGEPFSIYNEVDGVDFYVTYSPVIITGTDTPWMVGMSIPLSEIRSSIINELYPLLILSILGLLIVIAVVLWLSNGITGPILTITKMLKLMSKGDINSVKDIKIEREDEIGEIISSTNILVDNLKLTAEFAKEIGDGKLQTEFNSLSDKDILGNSLLNMRASLNKANIEEEKRREEEVKQNWATVGAAKFGEILRNNAGDMEAFTYSIISNLVKYTNSNQGALFLLNMDDEMDPFLMMSSCYAYQRKKFIDKRIDLGSNLVGQCYQEGQTIFMTDIPNDYITITSGLGDANPNTLILVPLKFNEKVYGVIELASFKKYETYQITFIEKLSESIASTISTVKVNLQTVQLLDESKLKSEELAAQEEEMRQNMEELQTTQEESARRELDMKGVLNALNSSYFVVELSLDADIININEKAKNLLAANGSVEGKNLRSMLEASEIDDFDDMWNKVISGESIRLQHTLNRLGSSVIVSESYTPIYNDMNDIYKVLNIGVEVI